MKSPFYFIAKPVGGSRYCNIKDIEGVELVVNTSEEDHLYSNRFADVIELPAGYEGPVKKGDILVVHHNVFKFYHDMAGNKRSGKSFYKDDLFFIEMDQFFMYYRDGEWTAHDRYCFVKPIPPYNSNHVFIKNFGTEEPLTGIMMFPNQTLVSQGVNKGDYVSFKPNSEYEFQIGGEKLYRVFDHHITIKF